MNKASQNTLQTLCICVPLLAIVVLMVYAMFFKSESFQSRQIDTGRDLKKMARQKIGAKKIYKLYQKFRKLRIEYLGRMNNMPYGSEDRKNFARQYAVKFQNLTYNINKLFMNYDINPYEKGSFEKYGGKIPDKLHKPLLFAEDLGQSSCYDRVDAVLKFREDLPMGYQDLGDAGEDLRNFMNDMCYSEVQKNPSYPKYPN